MTHNGSSDSSDGASSLGQRKLVATRLATLGHLSLHSLTDEALHCQLGRVRVLKVNKAITCSVQRWGE